MLMLQNSNDVELYIKWRQQAALLSQLTDGVHLHTVEALNKDSITKAEMLLKKRASSWNNMLILTIHLYIQYNIIKIKI